VKRENKNTCNKCAKDLCKRTVSVQLIIESVVTCFFGTQCNVRILLRCNEMSGVRKRIPCRRRCRAGVFRRFQWLHGAVAELDWRRWTSFRWRLRQDDFADCLVRIVKLYSSVLVMWIQWHRFTALIGLFTDRVDNSGVSRIFKWGFGARGEASRERSERGMAYSWGGAMFLLRGQRVPSHQLRSLGNLLIIAYLE